MILLLLFHWEKANVVRILFRIILLCVVLACGACQVQWVSSYDDVTDHGVTELHKALTKHLAGLKGKPQPECLFASHRIAYDSLLVDANSLLTRAEVISATSQNSQTIFQLQNLVDTVDTLRETHQASQSCLSDRFVEDAQDSLDVAFRAILMLELAKKRQPIKEER